MESGNLVGVQIGGNKRLRYKRARYFVDMGAGNIECIKSVAIGAEIISDRSHNQRLAAQKFKVVRNVSRCTAIFPPHIRHHEGHIQDVYLIGKNMLAKFAVKDHDGVVGE